MTPLRNDLYDDASVYDVLHTPGTAEDVDVLERLARRHGPRPRATRTCLEPACGTGRHLRLLARRGWRVTGYDRSPAMVEYARAWLRRHDLHRRARLFVADMADARLPLPAGSVDLAFNTINTLRHLPSDATMVDHLTATARVLRRGGLYAVGLSLTRYEDQSPEEDQWMGTRGRLKVNQVVQYLPPTGRTAPHRWEQVLSHLVVTRGTRREHVDSRYRLRCYDRAQWDRLVARAGYDTLDIVDAAGKSANGQDGSYGVFVLRPRARA